MVTVRVFVKFLESIDAIKPDLHTKVEPPSLSASNVVRTEMLDADRGEQVLGLRHAVHNGRGAPRTADLARDVEQLVPFNHIRLDSGDLDLVNVRIRKSELLAVERFGDQPPLVRLA